MSVGILGGTGSGKTTLVSLITRLYDVNVGEVKIFGHNVKDYTNDELYSLFGVAPQKAVLFEGTVRDNIRWGKEDATDEEIEKALVVSQSKEFVDNLKDGLDTMINQGGKNLSGGQRQRLTIARALVSNPKILILDDSSSALDFATDAKLRKALNELKKAKTHVDHRVATRDEHQIFRPYHRYGRRENRRPRHARRLNLFVRRLPRNLSFAKQGG